MTVYKQDIWDFNRTVTPRGEGSWAFAFTLPMTMRMAYDASKGQELWATPQGMKSYAQSQALGASSVMLFSEAKKVAMRYARMNGFPYVWLLS
jgi:hypothetical protein